MTESVTKTDETEPSTERPVLARSEWDRGPENTPVYAVVSAVAEATGADPLELPPLREAVDTDALNALFTSRPASSTGIDRVSFRYADCEVIVRASGTVRVRTARGV